MAAAASEEARARARRTGEALRQTRMERGITLADVEQDIRINHSYLEALEQARFDLLPAPVYARGFMRSYARYLGLDADEALRTVPRDLPRPADLDPIPGLRRAAPMVFPTFRPLTRSMAVVLGAAVVVLVLALVLVPRSFGGSEGDATPTPVPVATAQAEKPAPDLVGATREAATAALNVAGLTPLIFESPNAAPAGTVFRQSPTGGTSVRPGDVITLFVSQGSATVTATPAP